MKHIKTFEAFVNESSWDKGVVLTHKPSMFKKERHVKTSRDISIALDNAGIKNTWSAKTGEVFITNRNELSKAQKAIKGLDIEYIDESLAPLSEGKNKFRYDHSGWQMIYNAYNQTTHKTIEQEPMKFIDWLAKNTPPPALSDIK